MTTIMPTNLSITLENACLLENETNAVWVKEDSNFGTGYYFRGQLELLLFGEKGEMPVPETFKRISSVSLYLYAMKYKQVKMSNDNINCNDNFINRCYSHNLEFVLSFKYN